MADSVEAKVKEIIINELGVDPEKVSHEASFVEDPGSVLLGDLEVGDRPTSTLALEKRRPTR